MMLLCACNSTSTPSSPTPQTQTPSTSVPAQTHNVAGTVKQSTTATVVSDVRVEVIDGPSAGRFAMTDADGRYVLYALIDGRIRLRASRTDYATAEQTIVLGLDSTVDFTIVRGAACSLSGLVRESPANVTSAGAVVKLVREPGGYSAPSIFSTVTDASGTYRLGGVDCATRRLRVEKDDFFSHEESVAIGGDTRRDVVIERVTYPVRGIVRESPSGTPLVYATVEVVSGPYAGRKATTYVDGSYGLQFRDTARVRASLPGYVPQEVSVTVVAIPGVDQDFALTKQATAQ